MAEETNEIQEQETQQSAGDTSAVTENTEQPQDNGSDEQEHMIPKSRFDEINSKYKTAREELEAINKAKEDAARQALEEQGEYQKLYEELQGKLDAETERNNRLVYDQLRRDIASKHGYQFLWDRLRGETEEELTADLQGLISELPSPTAPSADGAAGSGGRTPEPTPITDARKAELAARLGIDVKFLPDFEYEID